MDISRVIRPPSADTATRVEAVHHTMESGSIPLADLDGGFDLPATLESGLTFLWRRADGERYGTATSLGTDAEAGTATADSPWYYTVDDGEVVFVRQRADSLEWRATTDATPLLRHRLRLDDDLDAVFAGFPDDEPLERARERFAGLRVVRDPFFPCLVSFVCSPRTGVGHIHSLQTALAREFGDAVTVESEAPGAEGVPVDRDAFHAFPRPARLADATETRLRDLGLGFRAPRVCESARMVASGNLTAAALRGEPYAVARDRLQAFPGVGPKVADCVALFALGHLEAVPMDRWTRRLIEAYYPDCDRESDDASADAFRDRFGQRAGYAQTYLYHYVRSGESAEL